MVSITSFLDRGFDEPIPEKFNLVSFRESWIGVAIVVDSREMGAICGKCRCLLGWTFEYEEGRKTPGFWSCLGGCKTIYHNKLKQHTSSIINLDNKDLDEWLSGWLGVDKNKIEVEVRPSE